MSNLMARLGVNEGWWWISQEEWSIVLILADACRSVKAYSLLWKLTSNSSSSFASIQGEFKCRLRFFVEWSISTNKNSGGDASEVDSWIGLVQSIVTSSTTDFAARKNLFDKYMQTQSTNEWSSNSKENQSLILLWAVLCYTKDD